MASWRVVETGSRTIAGWAVAALGFSLPISTTLDGILLVVALVAWTFSGIVTELTELIRRDRMILLLPGFFVVVAFGMAHGIIPFSERARHLWKYNDFLLPLVFVPLLVDPGVRNRSLWAFGLSMGLTLIVSLGLAAGLIPQSTWFHGHPANATVFKHQITHNVLMAFAAYLFAEVGHTRQVSWQRYAMTLMAFCAVIDVFMLVQGRTGQVILGTLIVLWCYRRFGIRGLFAGMTMVAILVTLSYVLSPVFQKRVEKTVTEMEQVQVDTVASASSSVGLRAEWYKNTAQLIAAHPVVGVGTGSFARAYSEMVTEPTAIKPAHPHNQYLLTAAELGLGGIGLLLVLFGMLWWRFHLSGRRLHAELGRCAVIALVIGCAFNSLLIDHTEGLFFAWAVSAGLAEGIGGDGHSC